MGSDVVFDPERTADIIDHGRTLVRAIEGLETIEPPAGFERTIARLLVKVDKRRLQAIIGTTVPVRVGNRILEASESIGYPRAAPFGEN